MTKIDSSIIKLINQVNLSLTESEELFQVILNGGLSNSNISAIVTSLKIKGENEKELAGYVNNLIGKSPLTFDLDVNILSLDIDNQRNFESLLLISNMIISQAGFKVVKYINKSLSFSSNITKFVSGLGVNHRKLTTEVARSAFAENNFAIINTDYLRSIYTLNSIIEEIKIKSILTLIPAISLPNIAKNLILLANSKAQAELFCNLLKSLSPSFTKAWIIYNDFNSSELLKDEVNYIIEVKGSKHKEITLDLRRYKFCSLMELDSIFNSNYAREIIFGKRNDFYNLVILYAGLSFMMIEDLTLEESIYKAEKIIQAGLPLDLVSKLINITNLSQLDAIA